MSRIYGLIGRPLSHSFSQKYFQEKFNREKLTNVKYLNFDISNIRQLTSLIAEHPDLQGLNVTIPYKEQVLPYLNGISTDAKTIGAVNTISISRQQGQVKLYGDNTDVIGFEESLLNLVPQEFLSKVEALILGTGGASKAVQFVFSKIGIPYRLVSNSKYPGSLSYEDLNDSILKQKLLIINTTPIGMYPKVDQAPKLKYEDLGRAHYLFDLIYNPERTMFLKHGMAAGSKIMNGKPMLIAQAEAAWSIWNSAKTLL